MVGHFPGERDLSMKITAMLKATMTHRIRTSSLFLLGVLLGSSASASAELPLAEELAVGDCHSVGEVLDLRVTKGRIYSPNLGTIDELREEQVKLPHPRYATDQTSLDLSLSLRFDDSASAMRVEVSDGLHNPWYDLMTVRPESGNSAKLRLPIGPSYRLTIITHAVPLADRSAVLKPVNTCTE